MNDIEIDKQALQGARLQISDFLGTYAIYAGDLPIHETGVGNPCGRTGLRVALEGALGQAGFDVQAQYVDGLGIVERLAAIDESFEELDVSLGSGWDVDYVADLT